MGKQSSLTSLWRVEPARFVDVLIVHSLRPALHRPALALVFEVGLRVGGNAPLQQLALNEPVRPHVTRDRRIRHKGSSDAASKAR